MISRDRGGTCTKQRYFGEKNYKNFGPRIGLAWQVMPNWTVRAAYGIFYEADLFNQYGAIPGASAFPYQSTYSLSADSVTPWKGIFNWDNGFPTDRLLAPVLRPRLRDAGRRRTRGHRPGLRPALLHAAVEHQYPAAIGPAPFCSTSAISET